MRSYWWLRFSFYRHWGGNLWGCWWNPHNIIVGNWWETSFSRVPGPLIQHVTKYITKRTCHHRCEVGCEPWISPFFKELKPTWWEAKTHRFSSTGMAHVPMSPRQDDATVFHDKSGWWFQPTPLKNDGLKVSWDDYSIPKMMGQSFKIPWFQSTNQKWHLTCRKLLNSTGESWYVYGQVKTSLDLPGTMACLGCECATHKTQRRSLHTLEL